MEEADEEEGEEGEEKEDESVTELGKSTHVDGTTDASGSKKRKHVDRGADSRKKKLLCQLAASSKKNIDTDMKKFMEGLVQICFKTFEEKFSQQFSDRIEKFETLVTRGWGRLRVRLHSS